MTDGQGSRGTSALPAHECRPLEVAGDPDAPALTAGVGPGVWSVNKLNGALVCGQWQDPHATKWDSEAALGSSSRDCDPASPGTCVCPRQTAEETQGGAGEGPARPCGPQGTGRGSRWARGCVHGGDGDRAEAKSPEQQGRAYLCVTESPMSLCTICGEPWGRSAGEEGGQAGRGPTPVTF